MHYWKRSSKNRLNLANVLNVDLLSLMKNLIIINTALDADRGI